MDAPATPIPFLPGSHVQYAWDSTSLGYLKTCPRLYYYTMIEGWRAREESIHLRFGIEYHRALQNYDISRAAGIKHDDAVFDVTRQLLLDTADFRPDDSIKNRGNLLRTVVWYLDQFENDPAQTVVLENGRPAVEVSFRFELEFGPDAGVSPYLLCGHLDRIVLFNDELFVMDRKTTKSTPSAYYFNRFEPDNQMSLYTFASQVTLHSPVKGVIIDAAQVGVGFSRFTRGLTYRTPDQLDEWLNDLRYCWLPAAEQYAVQGYWPQNDTACDKFGGCRFREICSKSPSVRDAFLKGNFEKGEPWNPLISRG